jgi:hypothetical protein
MLKRVNVYPTSLIEFVSVSFHFTLLWLENISDFPYLYPTWLVYIYIYIYICEIYPYPMEGNCFEARKERVYDKSLYSLNAF